MRGKAHPPEVKAAVIAALLAGASIRELARRYELTDSCVKNWKRELDTPRFRVVKPENVPDIDALLLTYLETSLRTLTTQAEHFGDPTWLQRQTADTLAVLHGVHADKIIRLLEALQRGAAARAAAAEADPGPVRIRELADGDQP